MKQTRLIMGMPVTVEITDAGVKSKDLEPVFDYFRSVDERFSTYKPESEISLINRGLPEKKWSEAMREVFELCEQTKRETKGYFDIRHDGQIDPSGLVKGWAIQNAAKLISDAGWQNYYVEAGGDIQTAGVNSQGKLWRVGLRNPFDREEVVKVLELQDAAVATSGTYIRGRHIYNPRKPGDKLDQVASLTVVGPNIFDADRFATAAFAMGPDGIQFIESLNGLEGYSIDSKGLAIMTSGFERYVANAA